MYVIKINCKEVYNSLYETNKKGGGFPLTIIQYESSVGYSFTKLRQSWAALRQALSQDDTRNCLLFTDFH